MRNAVSRLAAGAIPLVLTAVLTAGCSAEYSPIGPCFDEPQATPEMPAYPTVDRSSLPPRPLLEDYDRTNPSSMEQYERDLERYKLADEAYSAQLQADLAAYHALRNPDNIVIPVEDGVAEGDPRHVPPEIGSLVTGALLEVIVGGSTGTGFVTVNEAGEQVAVTAAHVVDGTRPRNIRLATATGDEITPIGGCVVHENGGQRTTVAEVVDFDVAILTLPEDVTDNPLRLAQEEPNPGEYVFAIDYRGGFNPNTGPAQSTAIVAPRSINTTQLRFVNGARDLGPNPSPHTFDLYHTGDGASGGPLMNSEGEVIGITTAGTKEGLHAGPDELEFNNVVFRGAPTNSDSWMPTLGWANPAQVVGVALSSPIVN